MRLDELDLGYDDEYDDEYDEGRGGSRSRHSRSRRSESPERGRGRGRKRRSKSLLALVLTLAILGALGGAAWYGADKLQGFLSTPDYNSGGSGEIVVEIKPGQGGTDIGATLFAKGVVKSAKAFVDACKANPRSTEIQPGQYRLRLQMRASDALLLLLDPTSRVVNRVAIPEGMIAWEVYKTFEAKTGIPVADFQTAAKDLAALGIPDAWFTRTDGKTSIKSVEGFLFPATYDVEPGTTAAQILKMMVDKFMEVAAKLQIMETAQKKGISPFEAVITASLAQAEAGVDEDLPKISRVVYNRVNQKMPLQFDVTTNYWLALQGQARKPSQKLTDAELNDPSNPYNSRLKVGLVPGPIGNPGELALAAALNPTPGTWLYFVLIDKQGHSAFATTDTEHEKNKQLAIKNGAL